MVVFDTILVLCNLMSRPLLPNSQAAPQGNNFFLFMMLAVSTMLMINMMNRPPVDPNILDKPIAKEPEAEINAEISQPESDSTPIEDTPIQPQQFVSLGSLDPNSSYRMLVTLTNRGAAIVRAELNERRFRDVGDLTGYLGQIVVDAEAQNSNDKAGVIVQIVGRGTPAEEAGLQIGDRILAVVRKIRNQEHKTDIQFFADLRNALLQTRPREQIQLVIERNSRQQTLTAILGLAPMSVLRPETTPSTFREYRDLRGLHGMNAESNNPLSFLLTLNSYGDRRPLNWPDSVLTDNSLNKKDSPFDKTINHELAGLELRNGNWQLVSSSETEAVFKYVIGSLGLDIRKTYRLSKTIKANDRNEDLFINDPFKDSQESGYHVTMEIEIRNLTEAPKKLAYQLDGPTGLPTEGAWHGRKNGPSWSGGYGLRDIVVRFHNGPMDIVPNFRLAKDAQKPWAEAPLKYIGVDTRYFQCTAIPIKSAEGEPDLWHAKSAPMRIGPKFANWTIMTDVSWRLISKETEIEPSESLKHAYTVFIGPKAQNILSNYNLRETLYSGYFWWVAEPMLWVLHFFYYFVNSYAIAIILLTVSVRLAMFPLSRKQAQGMQKMAIIQPEMEHLKEKHKGNNEAMLRAQQELWKKHNYHPLSGCLPIFVQLPIFIGLYSALSIDVALYGASLISESVRWCNDLSAPDMLFDWSPFWERIGWPQFNTGHGVGLSAMFVLGPYFNLLPLVTIGLFILQQQVMMPPPTDEQQKMQRMMMNYMMIFMGFMFFRVPSGLCVYFIASTTWGLLERRFMPKPIAVVPKTIDVHPEKKHHDKKEVSHVVPEKNKKPSFWQKLQQMADKAAEKPGLGNSSGAKKEPTSKKNTKRNFK